MEAQSLTRGSRPPTPERSRLLAVVGVLDRLVVWFEEWCEDTEGKLRWALTRRPAPPEPARPFLEVFDACFSLPTFRLEPKALQLPALLLPHAFAQQEELERHWVLAYRMLAQDLFGERWSHDVCRQEFLGANGKRLSEVEFANEVVRLSTHHGWNISFARGFRRWLVANSVERDWSGGRRAQPPPRLPKQFGPKNVLG